MSYFVVVLANRDSEPVLNVTVQAEGAYYAAVNALRQHLAAHPAQYLFFDFVPRSSSVMQAGRLLENGDAEMLDVFIDLNNIWATEHKLFGGKIHDVIRTPAVPHA